MKLFSVLVCLCSMIYPQTFHSLDGIENAQGETILLYRLGSDITFHNPVFRFNTSTLSEELIVGAGESLTCLDFEFFPASESQFINIGYNIGIDLDFHIARNDTVVYTDLFPIWWVDISKQDPLKVFAFPRLVRSWDGGYTFPVDSIPAITNFSPASLADFDDNVFFGFNEDGKFCKNGSIVDTSNILGEFNFKMMYDKNQMHVYRTNQNYSSYTFNVSYDKGNAFSWSESFRSEKPIVTSIDKHVPGEIYLSPGNNIVYRSVNFGYNFNPYYSLPYKITGLYKKPGTEILYAASSYLIYEITPDTQKIIKSLPLTADLFDWFPMRTGNTWVYNHSELNDWCLPVETHPEAFTITKDTVISGYSYYKFEPPLVYQYSFIRIDSLEGKLKAIPLGNSTEVSIYDFRMEPGDTIFLLPADPFLGGFQLIAEDSILLFEDYRKIRHLSTLGFLPPAYSIVKSIGYYYDSFCEFGGWTRQLKGCVLNGIVYGDTTITGVQDYDVPLPAEFIIYQNFPNPFNPATNIKYSLPDSRFVTVKIFDILGNEIAVLVKEVQTEGTHEFTWNSEDLPGGIYLCHFSADNYSGIIKMALVK